MKKLILISLFCVATQSKGLAPALIALRNTFIANPGIKSEQAIGEKKYVKYYPDIPHEITSLIIGGGAGAMIVSPTIGTITLLEALPNILAGQKVGRSSLPVTSILLNAVTMGAIGVYIPLKLGATIANWSFRRSNQKKAE